MHYKMLQIESLNHCFYNHSDVGIIQSLMVCSTSLGTNDTWENANKKVERTLPPSKAFLIFFFLAQRAIGRLGVRKRARTGAGSE